MFFFSFSDVCVCAFVHFLNPFWLEHQRAKLQTQRLKFVSEKVLNRKTQFSEKRGEGHSLSIKFHNFPQPEVALGFTCLQMFMSFYRFYRSGICTNL